MNRYYRAMISCLENAGYHMRSAIENAGVILFILLMLYGLLGKILNFAATMVLRPVEIFVPRKQYKSRGHH